MKPAAFMKVYGSWWFNGADVADRYSLPYSLSAALQQMKIYAWRTSMRCAMEHA